MKKLTREKIESIWAKRKLTGSMNMQLEAFANKVQDEVLRLNGIGDGAVALYEIGADGFPVPLVAHSIDPGTKLYAAPPQQEQAAEPIAYLWINPDGSKEVTFVKPEEDQDVTTILALELGRKYQPLYTAPQQEQAAPVVVPQGWKLVPVEPTADMKVSAQEADMDHGDHDEWLEFEWPNHKEIWDAMLSSAPAPQEKQP